jgi:hypothetical protein
MYVFAIILLFYFHFIERSWSFGFFGFFVRFLPPQACLEISRMRGNIFISLNKIKFTNNLQIYFMAQAPVQKLPRRYLLNSVAPV